MKTPMQEMFDQLKASKKDEYGLAFAIDMLLENEQEMLKKEKEMMIDFACECRNLMAGDEFVITYWYDKTFNTKKK